MGMFIKAQKQKNLNRQGAKDAKDLLSESGAAEKNLRLFMPLSEAMLFQVLNFQLNRNSERKLRCLRRG